MRRTYVDAGTLRAADRMCDACGVPVPLGTIFFVDAPPAAGQPSTQLAVCRACYLRAELIAGNDYRGGWKVAWLLKRSADARASRYARLSA